MNGNFQLHRVNYQKTSNVELIVGGVYRLGNLIFGSLLIKGIFTAEVATQVATGLPTPNENVELFVGSQYTIGAGAINTSGIITITNNSTGECFPRIQFTYYSTQ